MKTIFKANQFFHQNEPKLAALIGNLSLLLAAIGGIPSVLASEGITAVPPILLTTAHYALASGVVIKIVTKLFGTVDNAGNPVNSTCPPVDSK